MLLDIRWLSYLLHRRTRHAHSQLPTATAA